MKRRSKVGLNAASGNAEAEQNFWPSYADMMSSFALILFFLMLLVYLSSLKTGNSLKDTEKQLSETLSLLSITQEEADEANATLLQTQDKLSNAESQLSDAEEILATVQIKLDAANAELEGQQLILTTQQAKLDAQQATIDQQSAYLSQTQAELEKMYGQMETIVGIRRSILEQIKQNIDSVMGDSSKVSIGDNGNIILNEGVFFDSGKSELKEESVTVLNRLVDVFSRFLSNQDNAKFIESVVISGHTDADGTEESNLVLSTERADAVLAYMLENPVLAGYSQYFCAAGYGETRPVADNYTEDGKAQNRRIEISIILRDDTVMDIVNEYLSIDLPAAEVTE